MLSEGGPVCFSSLSQGFSDIFAGLELVQCFKCVILFDAEI